jgi:cytoskeletal protein RodZ
MIQPSLRVECRFPSGESEITHLPSFGEKLKSEREKRKISLDQISSTTKIGTRMLQALEEEKFSQLPGGIFNKGFVRAYARVVGLDEDQTVADYLQASGDATVVKLEPTRDGAAHESAPRKAATRDEENRISRLEAISDEPSRPVPWGVFAVILLVVALLLSFWSHRRREQERQEAHPVPGKSTGQSRGATLPPAAMTTASDSSIAGSPASSSSSASNSARPSLLPSASLSNTSLPSTSQAIQNSNFAPTPGEFLVLIHAREESWVSVTVDGKFAGSELLESGSERVFHGQKDVAVKAGNAGALDFQLNGKKLDVGGDFGEVKSITIGHAGLIRAASTAPTTP